MGENEAYTNTPALVRGLSLSGSSRVCTVGERQQRQVSTISYRAALCVESQVLFDIVPVIHDLIRNNSMFHKWDLLLSEKTDPNNAVEVANQRPFFPDVCRQEEYMSIPGAKNRCFSIQAEKLLLLLF